MEQVRANNLQDIVEHIQALPRAAGSGTAPTLRSNSKSKANDESQNSYRRTQGGQTAECDPAAVGRRNPLSNERMQCRCLFLAAVLGWAQLYPANGLHVPGPHFLAPISSTGKAIPVIWGFSPLRGGSDDGGKQGEKVAGLVDEDDGGRNSDNGVGGRLRSLLGLKGLSQSQQAVFNFVATLLLVGACSVAKITLRCFVCSSFPIWPAYTHPGAHIRNCSIDSRHHSFVISRVNFFGRAPVWHPPVESPGCDIAHALSSSAEFRDSFPVILCLPAPDKVLCPWRGFLHAAACWGDLGFHVAASNAGHWYTYFL